MSRNAELRVRGLIPAHAGSTWRRGLWGWGQRAHPRSRGEHSTNPMFFFLNDRLIPAHAGSTCSNSASAPMSRAHPRSRGEHFVCHTCKQPSGGSSPLTRGAPNACPISWTSSRLIPAHAGSTMGKRRRRLLSEAHPRSRGEHFQAAEFSVDVTGSSPLTRGAPLTMWPHTSVVGLIPAHAGSTTPHEWGVRGIRAHPRSRGEHVIHPSLVRSRGGSSPLTRGARGT